MFPRDEDLSGTTVKIIDIDGNEQCAQTYDSPAAVGTGENPPSVGSNKYFDYDCLGLLNYHVASKVRFERLAGKVSVVQVGLLYACTCYQTFFVGSDLSSTAVTVVVGNPVKTTFTLLDYVSLLFGTMDGTTHCGNLTPSSFVFRDADTFTDIAIGSVAATGTTAEISFDPDETHGGAHSLNLYAILNGVERLLFSNIEVTVETTTITGGTAVTGEVAVKSDCAFTKFIEQVEEPVVKDFKVTIPLPDDTVSNTTSNKNFCDKVLHLFYNGTEIPFNYTFKTLTVEKVGPYIAFFEVKEYPGIRTADIEFFVSESEFLIESPNTKDSDTSTTNSAKETEVAIESNKDFTQN